MTTYRTASELPADVLAFRESRGDEFGFIAVRTAAGNWAWVELGTANAEEIRTDLETYLGHYASTAIAPLTPAPEFYHLSPLYPGAIPTGATEAEIADVLEAADCSSMDERDTYYEHTARHLLKHFTITPKA